MASDKNNETTLAQIDINNKMQGIKYIENDCEQSSSNLWTPSR